MLRAVLLLTGKDLRRRARDGSVLIFAVLAPLVLAAIFTFVLGDLTSGPSEVTWVVADEDGDELVAPLVDELLPALAADLDGTVEPLADRPAVVAAIEEGAAEGGVVVPAGTSDAIVAGRPAELEVLGDASSVTSVAVLEAVVGSYTDRVGAVQRASAAASVLGADAAATAEVAEAASTPALELVEGTTTGRVLDPRTGLAAGMAVFFLLFAVQFGVLALFEERSTGTLARLRAAPIRFAAIPVAAALTAFVIGVVSMGVLVLATSLLLGASWGPWGGVALLVVFGVFAATGLVAGIGLVARTAEQAASATGIAAVVLGMLGGSFFPVGGNTVLERISLATPHAWFLRGLSDLAAGVTPVASWLALTAFGLVGGLAAALLLRREVAP
jgi:ABC-2 type transport system permease protein